MELRMPRPSRVSRMVRTPGRSDTSLSSRSVPVQSVSSRSHITHLTVFGLRDVAGGSARRVSVKVIAVSFHARDGWANKAGHVGIAVLADYQLLQFTCAFDDFHDLGIAVIPLHRVSFGAAVRAVDLDGVVRRAHRGRGRELLGNSDF